ncbi:hypothetical protein STEG23_032882 [Scotinomys teguina]
MKRPNIRIIGIEEGEEYQLKGTEKIFNKIIEVQRKKSIISLNSTQEVDSNSANSYIEYSPFNNKRRGMLLHSVEQIGCNAPVEPIATYFQCIQQSKVDQNNSILHHRKKSIISLNSTQEVDSNSANSYIEYSPFNNKRRGMLLHSVEQIGCNGKKSIISLNSTQVDSNSNPYINTVLNKRRRMLLYFVEQIGYNELSIVI